MRLITVKAPVGLGQHIAGLAFAAGIPEVNIRQEVKYAAIQKEQAQDVVEIETATPKANKFIESLLVAPFYNPATFTFTVRHPEAVFAAEPVAKETYPIIRPVTDVYQELWQFSWLTISLAGRVFLSAVLLAYGMVENMLPLIIAGLLFLPYHHHMLAVGLGAVLREWKFLVNGLLALLVSTGLILLAGVCVALFTAPPIGFEEFGTPLSGFILSIVIGVAAALAALDDAGRRELIGLAATSHLSIYPAWFGLKLIFGFSETDKIGEHLITFGINFFSLIVAAGCTFALMGMRGEGIRRFMKQKAEVK